MATGSSPGRALALSSSGQHALPDLESTAAFAEFVQANISDEYLLHHCGVEDLRKVTRLEISVDSEEQTVESLGSQLPNLRELKLVQSLVHSIRDLGTQLHNLKVLWMNRCGLKELAGIVALPLVEELYLSFNEIGDLSPLSYNDTIQVLDLEGNSIEASEVEYLETLGQLRELNLAGNPVARRRTYVRDTMSALPNLALLDDELVAQKDLSFDDKDASPSLGECSTDVEPGLGSEPDEDQLVLEGLKKGVYKRMLSRQSSTARPATAAPAAWGGPASAPCTFRPQTAMDEELGPDSELTIGSEAGIAGNPLNAIRHRRRIVPQKDVKEDIRALLQRFETYAQTCLSEEEIQRRVDERPRTSLTAGMRISRGRPVTAAQLGADEPVRRGDVPAPVLVGSAEMFVL